MNPRIITLIGPRSVGKNLVGRELAKKLKFKLIDLDEVLNKKLKGSIGGYAHKYGWERTRRREYKILQSLIKKAKRDAILVTGGGTVASENKFSRYNAKFLKEKTEVILLLPSKSKTKSIEVLYKRELKRPHFIEILKNKQWTKEYLKNKTKIDYELRVPSMKKAAEKIIYRENKTPKETANLIIKAFD